MDGAEQQGAHETPKPSINRSASAKNTPAASAIRNPTLPFWARRSPPRAGPSFACAYAPKPAATKAPARSIPRWSGRKDTVSSSFQWSAFRRVSIHTTSKT
jgi:hypothetical protein